MQNNNKNPISEFHEYARVLRTKTLESIMDSSLIEGSHDLGTNHEILYHYCTLSSFFSIIRSNCFWLSYPKFMNDLSEYKNSKEIIIGKLEECKLNSSLNPDCLGIVDRVIKYIKPDDENEDLDLEYKKYDFCMSFTSDNDCLPMWCGYTGKDVGVAIGLNFADSNYFYAGERNLFDPKPRGRFIDLIYDNNKLEKIVNDYLEGINQYCNKIASNSEFDKQWIINRMFDEMKYFYLSSTYYFKNSDFKYEKETRFIYNNFNDTKNINFRVKNNFIVPYIEYPPILINFHGNKFHINRDDYKLPIVSVMISPNTEEPELVLDSIKAYLRSKDYPIDKIDFDKSHIPYKQR